MTLAIAARSRLSIATPFPDPVCSPLDLTGWPITTAGDCTSAVPGLGTLTMQFDGTGASADVQANGTGMFPGDPRFLVPWRIEFDVTVSALPPNGSGTPAMIPKVTASVAPDPNAVAASLRMTEDVAFNSLSLIKGVNHPTATPPAATPGVVYHLILDNTAGATTWEVSGGYAAGPISVPAFSGGFGAEPDLIFQFDHDWTVGAPWSALFSNIVVCPA